VTALFQWCLGYQGPSFLRMASIPYVSAAQTPQGWRPVEGCGYVLREGDAGVIFAAGLVGVAEALAAAEILAQAGQQWRVVAHPWLNRVDPAWLAETISGRPAVVTIDNHFLAGGQGQMLTAAIAALPGREKPQCLSLGLHETPPSGRNDEVLARVGLDAASIAARIRAFGGAA
jgi:transketolase